MKRFAAILLAVIILLSGMHFTIAAHYCGGKAVALKISLTGAKAGCGMESDESAKISGKALINTRCCYDELSVYKVENQYAPSEFGQKLIVHNMFHPVMISPGSFTNIVLYASTNLPDAGPPEPYAVSAVSAARICVFRI